VKRLIAIVAAISLGCSVAAAQQPRSAWVQAFEISPATYSDDGQAPLPANPPPEYAYLTDKTPVRGTIRLRLAVSTPGTELRVRLSNELGSKPLTVDGASIGRAAAGLDAATGTLRRLTFGSKPSVTIPPGAPMLSDPIDFKVDTLEELVVSVFVDQPIPRWPRGVSTMGLSDRDAVMDAKLPAATALHSRPIVTGILVTGRQTPGVIVAFGDSITDGSRPIPTEPHGWVYTFARRLSLELHGSSARTVVSAGISGNRVISDGSGPSALARADRDVFSVPGLTHVILLEGINDIGKAGATDAGNQPPLDLDDLLTGYKQIVARAHIRGVKIIGGTLTPFRGAHYFTEEKEKQRLQVNRWIRASGVFDSVIDFDAAVRDPAHPDRLKAEYDSGDHLHPGPAGYRAMGEMIDLRLFR
jgi:lysophospholipase L1-like esterase